MPFQYIYRVDIFEARSEIEALLLMRQIKNNAPSWLMLHKKKLQPADNVYTRSYTP